MGRHLLSIYDTNKILKKDTETVCVSSRETAKEYHSDR